MIPPTFEYHAPGSVDDAIARSKAYVEAGVDAIFLVGVPSRAALEAVCYQTRDLFRARPLPSCAKRPCAKRPHACPPRLQSGRRWSM